jgi:hypothetical protein
MTPFSDEISYINQKQNTTYVNDNHSKRGILTWILCRGLQEGVHACFDTNSYQSPCAFLFFITSRTICAFLFLINDISRSEMPCFQSSARIF